MKLQIMLQNQSAGQDAIIHTIDDETSHSITSLRFLLSVFVVGIHSVIDSWSFETYKISKLPFVTNIVQEFFLSIFSVAVPLFFL